MPLLQTVGTENKRITPKAKGRRDFHQTETWKQLAFETMRYKLRRRIYRVGAKIRLKPVKNGPQDGVRCFPPTGFHGISRDGVLDLQENVTRCVVNQVPAWPRTESERANAVAANGR